MIKFTVNKSTLLVDRNKDYILMRVPNSHAQNYVAFDLKKLIAENDKTCTFEIAENSQIAMWNGRPNITYAASAQEDSSFSHSSMQRISAQELYSDYYVYSESSDPSVKQRRQERLKAFQNKATKTQSAINKQANAGQEEQTKQEVEPNKPTSSTAESSAEQRLDKADEVDKFFKKEQMVEILKGLMQGVDITEYNRKELSAEQMKELRLGLRAGMDVSEWNSKYISADVMRELRKYDKQGIKLQDKHIDASKYDAQQLKEIRLGINQKVTIKHYLNPEYTAEQMKEIRLGQRANLKSEIYESPDFSAEQMRMLRHRLIVNKIIDVLKNFLQTVRTWIADRAESVAAISLSLVTPKEIESILEVLPPEQSPLEQIKDILVKSEMVDAVSDDLDKYLLESIEKYVSASQSQEYHNPDVLAETTAFKIVSDTESDISGENVVDKVKSLIEPLKRNFVTQSEAEGYDVSDYKILQCDDITVMESLQSGNDSTLEDALIELAKSSEGELSEQAWKTLDSFRNMKASFQGVGDNKLSIQEQTAEYMEQMTVPEEAIVLEG